MKDKNLKDWGEVLGAVCKHPRMYVALDTLHNVLDFIGGYLFAQSLLSPEPEVPSSSLGISEEEPEWGYGFGGSGAEPDGGGGGGGAFSGGGGAHHLLMRAALM